VLNRRELFASAAAGVVLSGWRGAAAVADAPPAWRAAFAAAPDGPGWPGFACVDVANLRIQGGQAVLEAGSDVFPNDPRPVAFAVDRRFRDGSVTARATRTGSEAGVVVRRTSHRHYYAAIYRQEEAALVVVRRSGAALKELARTPAVAVRLPVTLTLESSGSAPTRLRATLADAGGAGFAAAATDGHPSLQAAGDPGVLTRATTLFPSERNEVLPPLGNVHLLPYGVQEGNAFIESPAGQSVVDVIRDRSTASFSDIHVQTDDSFAPTPPSVVAATTGVPGERGTTVHVATDLPARVAIEVADGPGFRNPRRVDAGQTGDFEAAVAELAGATAGRPLYWRAVVSRRGKRGTGPARSFRGLPEANASGPVKLAVAACASQFGPVFDHLARRNPDVFVWQGDLNYPDTHGPLAQSMAGYAGIWRDFLANPRIAPVLERTCFVAGRDDHDYGVQDAHSRNQKPFGLRPWDALMARAPYHRFSAGVVDVWVLDQRLFKTPPDAPDTEAKTLLGARQRAWLLRTLEASRAPFKVICSPCTLSAAKPENPRDGNWSGGYTAERELLLRHVATKVTGRTVFVTGDTHYTMVYDRDGVFEARPCPLDIPVPNDITLSDPRAAATLAGRPGVAYADDTRGHFALIEAGAEGRRAHLELTLVRQDGVAAYTKRFEEPLPADPAGGEPQDGPGTGRAPAGRRTPASGDAGAGRGRGGGLPFTGGRPVALALAGTAVAAAGLLARVAAARYRRG